MSPSRRALAAGLLLGLGACGFTPMYAQRDDGISALDALNRVSIANIADRPGQEMRNFLIDRFYTEGRPQKTDYDLQIVLTTSEAQLAIQSDATATRAQMTVIAAYSLREKTSGKVLINDNDRAVISYNIQEAQYGTVVSRDNAIDRGVEQLSGVITNRVAAALRGPLSGQASPGVPAAGPAPSSITPPAFGVIPQLEP